MHNNIRYIVMDVDGTLTDGKIYMGEHGEIFKAFNIKDGCGIKDICIHNGITPIIITGRESTILVNRCKELGITHLYQGIHDKLRVLTKIVEDLSKVAYIGDDINDIACMKAIKRLDGIVGCPADAVDSVKKIADYVSHKQGGDGAVREFIDWILEEKSVCE